MLMFVFVTDPDHGCWFLFPFEADPDRKTGSFHLELDSRCFPFWIRIRILELELELIRE